MPGERRFGSPRSESERIYQHYLQYGSTNVPVRGTGLKKPVGALDLSNMSRWLPYLAIGGILLWLLSGKMGGLLGEGAIERYERRGTELAGRAEKYRNLAQKLREVESAKEAVKRLEEEAKGLR